MYMFTVGQSYKLLRKAKHQKNATALKKNQNTTVAN